MAQPGLLVALDTGLEKNKVKHYWESENRNGMMED